MTRDALARSRGAAWLWPKRGARRAPIILSTCRDLMSLTAHLHFVTTAAARLQARGQACLVLLRACKRRLTKDGPRRGFSQLGNNILDASVLRAL
jgi:hypothetical protein